MHDGNPLSGCFSKELWVMVQSLSFVQKTYPNQRTQAPYEENGQASDDLAKLQFTSLSQTATRAA